MEERVRIHTNNTHTHTEEIIVKNDEHGGVIQSSPGGKINLSTTIMVFVFLFLLYKRRAETGKEKN